MKRGNPKRTQLLPLTTKTANQVGSRYNRLELVDTSRFRVPPRGSRATDDTQSSLL
jgi:hypothetical protein